VAGSTTAGDRGVFFRVLEQGAPERRRQLEERSPLHSGDLEHAQDARKPRADLRDTQRKATQRPRRERHSVADGCPAGR